MTIDDQIKLTRDTLTALMAVKDSGVPDGWVLEYRGCDNTWQLSAGPSDMAADDFHYRLRKIDPPKPRKVPLTRHDVPEGSAFSANYGDGYVTPNVDSRGIDFRSFGKDYSYTWKELMDRGFHIKRPGSDWHLCEKDAE